MITIPVKVCEFSSTVITKQGKIVSLHSDYKSGKGEWI